MSSHSAAGPALGYIYQLWWPLLKLIDDAYRSPDVQFRLERTDDLEIQNGLKKDQLVQIKHHTGTSTLTANSVDFWRTVNVWMDTALSSDARLCICTTQKISPSSDLKLLRGGDARDSKTACQEIEKTAGASGSKETKKWRERFLSLTEQQRADMVDCITIFDGETKFSSLDEELRKRLALAIPLNHGVEFLGQLKSWWNTEAIKMLYGTRSYISGHELRRYISDLRDSFGPSSLPIDETIDLSIVRGDPGEYSDELFIKQLDWVGEGEPHKSRAVAEYDKATRQRSYWLKNLLIAERELLNFECGLFDEWDQLFIDYQDEVNSTNGADLKILSRRLRRDLSKQSRVTVRKNFSQTWFTNGSLEILANGENEKFTIGWHPDFQKYI